MFKIEMGKSVTAAALLATVAFMPAFADNHGMNEHIAAAVANSDRPNTDTDRDAARKPGEVLAFAGVKPGMTVVDINSGGGYYTEILSYAVGAEGKVYAHNGPLYWNFVKTRVGERFEDRLPNVEQIHKETENVTIGSESADLAITVLAYHDYYFLPEGREDPADVSAVLASIYSSLKPGGAF
ncbi:MAG: methyltransferase, partial [Kordiimonas sp.]